MCAIQPLGYASGKGRGGAVEKEERQKSMRQGADSVSCSFLSLFLFLPPPLAVSRLFGLQARSQAVLFALWMTVRKLTRLLVFEMYACDHTWKKDLQQWALAGGLWLFIPSFPKAIGLFFKEHTIYLGAGRKGADLQRVTGGEGWGWGCFSDSFQAKWTLIILGCSH